MIETITYNYEYEVYCDSCDFRERYYADDWQEFMYKMKEDKWFIKRIGRDWEHYCIECSKTLIQDDFEDFYK